MNYISLIHRCFCVMFGLVLMTISSNGFTESYKEIRIGYQQYGTLIFVKARGSLEKRLAPLGKTVKWLEFAAGIKMVEALKQGEIDFAVTGGTPPLFAQAAQVPFVYIGNEPSSPQSQAILVLKNSPIQKLDDLKGKKIALFAKTIAHTLLINALEKVQLSLADVQVVDLPSAEAKQALQEGKVDAWVTWDPYFAVAQDDLDVRVLADGQDGLCPGYQFYLAHRDYAEENAEVIRKIVDEINMIGIGTKQNTTAAAKFLAPRLGMKINVLEVALKRMNTGFQFINPEVIAAQQETANTLHRTGLLPNKIVVQDIIWNGIIDDK